MTKIVAALLMCCALVSCSSVKWVNVERLCPAKMELPEKIRRVAVLNNQPLVMADASAYYLDARQVTDSLAQFLADVAYFDEVVVSDTVLASNMLIDYKGRELRPTVVANLCHEYDADMLVTVDYVAFIPDNVQLPFVTGTVDVRVTCYLQGAVEPLTAIHEQRWLDWGEWYYLKPVAVSLAASAALPVIVPQWCSEEFPFYAGANVGQRDAAVFVREGNWDDAAELWCKQLTHKNRHRRMEAHLNMAVYHEIKDDSIGRARVYAKEALKLAAEEVEFVKGKVVNPTGAYRLINGYLKDLERRGRDLEQIKRQMQRFSDDF